MVIANGHMMHIGELAERSEMSLRTIRHYDEVGLLTPTGRSEGGFRQYTERDLARLMVIRRMKPLGFSLEEMGELLRIVDALDAGDAPDDAASALRAALQGSIAQATAQRAKLHAQLAMADEFIELLRTR